MKKQKNVFISYLLFYGGFLLTINSMVLILIYTLVFKNYVVDVVHLILFILLLLGIVTPLFASNFNLAFYFTMHAPNYKLRKKLLVDSNKGFIQGVPNNKFEEFKTLTEIINGIITFEYKSGIFFGDYKGKSIIIDMNGWIFKKKYLLELLHTSLRINYINNKKLSLKYTYSTIADPNVKSLIVKIKSGCNQKKYYISYDGKIKSSISLLYKNYTKSKFIDKRKKLSITDFYDLNY